MKFQSLIPLSALALLLACGDDSSIPTGSATSAGGGPSGGQTSSQSGSGGMASTTSSSGQGGSGGSGLSSLEDLLVRLRADRDGTLLLESREHGWPVLVDEGRVVVSTDGALDMVAGDFDSWLGTQLTADQGFSYAILPDTAGDRYKLTDGVSFIADPWSRGYDYDTFGEISTIPPTTAHLERFFQVDDAPGGLAPRNVRVWVPAGTPTHVLYLHDGQNLFDPDSAWGGWNLQATAPAGMMLVGIDNTNARMDEYTQVADDIGSGAIGGLGDEYADLVELGVRPLIAEVYGEAPKVGTLGSSLGGLISLHIGYLNPAGYDFVGSMSGTMGWGSFGPHTGQTMIERYEGAGVLGFVVYLDSGGSGTCADSDADGIFDDGDDNDNFCVNNQMRDTLFAEGYVFDVNLHHWHQAGASHNEAAWAARVFRPLGIFAAL